MLPKTHHLIINEAIDRTGSWPRKFRQEILQGNDDEDVHVVPIVKWRVRAAGLTHTHVPNGFFGELLFPSAKRRAHVFLKNANDDKIPPKTRAWWLGRTCHLLGDVSVPARARRIWHIEGDPLEAWIERHWEMFRNAPVENMISRTPDEIFEEVAHFAATFPADTTRTPWGRAMWNWFGRGEILQEAELKRQAWMLIPRAITATKTMLECLDLS